MPLARAKVGGGHTGRRYERGRARCSLMLASDRREAGTLLCRCHSPTLRRIPIVDVLADLVLGHAVALLDLTFQLLAAAVDRVEIVVCELAPLFLYASLDLLPVSLHAVPIHLLAPSEKKTLGSETSPGCICSVLLFRLVPTFPPEDRHARVGGGTRLVSSVKSPWPHLTALMNA